MIKQIVILGGGTAGWMTAAALSRALNGKVALTLVDSEEIGIVGVGEATIPPIILFNRMLGIDEDDFLRQTQGTFKLGVEFVDWYKEGHRYMHAFGEMPRDIQLASFEQVWQKMRQCGHAYDLGAYSITMTAAYAGKFMRPPKDGSMPLLDGLGYAFHFDASLYARYLRKYAAALNVTRIEGKVTQVQRNVLNGDITALVLHDDRTVAGDFFVDCSGFRGRLIEEEFHTGYEDWTHWLPCDRAVAVPCASGGDFTPYTRSTSRHAGWQWRIPLQHRTGNGHVFCSRYISEDEATASLLANLDGDALAEPRTLRFATGMRRKAWHRNCVAIGLSSGFIEPLESTSIHFIQTAITRLLAFFPSKHPSDKDINEYNRLSRAEFEHVRDFIVLHYYANQRSNSAFWEECRHMEIPASLRHKLDLYQAHGRFYNESVQLFMERNLAQVMQGQGLAPKGYHPVVDAIGSDDIEAYFADLRKAIAQQIQQMPSHADFIRTNCRAV